MFSEKDTFLSIEKFFESFLVDHVFSSSSGCIDKEILLGSSPGTGHVELSVGKAGVREIHANHPERLALALVDLHRKAESYRQLKPLELEGHV